MKIISIKAWIPKPFFVYLGIKEIKIKVMITFTIYNKETKTITEDKDFNNGYEADKYTKETYGEGWTVVTAKNAFKFSSDFIAMLKDGDNERFLKNHNSKYAGIISEDGKTLYTAGNIKISEYIYLWKEFNIVDLSRKEFIKMWNSLAN